jgi:GrpB-like predicted nucleotidyltransferase (UPF0157 family)
MTRRFAYAIALVLALLAAPSVSRAQRSHDDGITRDEIRRFDDFLADHPAVERDLARQPGLATDRRYLADHPGLRDFLADHPGIREELRENPRRFVRAEQHFDHDEDRRVDDRFGREPLDREQVARLDRFLDDHPEVAHDLRSNPWIVNDRRYLEDHPSFRDFLGDHPTIREELQQSPRAVLDQERRFDRDDAHGETRGPAEHHDWHAPAQHHPRSKNGTHD